MEPDVRPDHGSTVERSQPVHGANRGVRASATTQSRWHAGQRHRSPGVQGPPESRPGAAAVAPKFPQTAS